MLDICAVYPRDHPRASGGNLSGREHIIRALTILINAATYIFFPLSACDIVNQSHRAEVHRNISTCSLGYQFAVENTSLRGGWRKAYNTEVS